MKHTNIRVISAGLVHPSLLCRFHLKKLLLEKERCTFSFTSRLSSLQALAEFDIVVLYFHKKTISRPLLTALESFAAKGGGILALHSVAASFKQQQRFFNLIGGRFLRHGAISTYTVQKTDAVTGIYNAIPDFVVKDELYLHEHADDVIVHFATKKENQVEPVVWTRVTGGGKIVYCSLGHCHGVMRHPQVKALIHQSLDWLKATR